MSAHTPKLVASLVIAGGFIWAMRRGGLPLLPDPTALAAVSWWAVPAYVVLLMLSFYLRAYRWIYLLRPIAEVSTRKVLGIGLIGSAAILFAPLRMGEVVRPYMIASRRISFTQAAGTIAAERVIDGLVISVILFLGLQLSTPLSPLPHHLGKLPLPVAAVPAAAYGALTLFTCAFLAMAVFYWRRDLARRLTRAVIGPFSEKLAGWFTERVEHLADGLKFLPSTKHSLPFLRETLLYWFLNTFSMWVLLRGTGIEASFAQTGVAMGVLGVGILVPAGPGFFGAFQLSIYSALAMFFPEHVVLGPGSVYVFLLYISQLAVSVVGMLVGFWLERGASDR
jgi:hypothetical protein